MSDLIKDKPVVINVHGFPTTEQFTSYDEWLDYAQNRLSMVKDRVSIADFLSRDQFIRNKRDENPEPKRVENMFDDPLPPDGPGVLIGQRRSGFKNSAHPDYRENGFQRREWGFREKILQGYPEYEPDKIGYGDLNNKVIAGFVTVGDGVFSGIPSYADISLDTEETRRQVEYGYGRSTGRQIVPSGLSFIQDDTAAIGVSLGSDVRYIWHPRLYNTNLSNPALFADKMHMGSMSVPKGDYRQFLRVGDFVVIEIGTRLKYWHSLLGARPDYWETLVGYRELFDTYGRDEKSRIIRQIIETGTYIPSQIDSKGRDFKRKSLSNPVKTFGQSERFRDTPYHHESKQPIIDHPWSTGTPIPVNSGMPYVMMEEYVVDSRERFGPPPIEIKISDIRDLQGNGTNLGSQLRGLLVQLKNVRFVKPPKGKELWIPKKYENLEPKLYQISGSKYAPQYLDPLVGSTTPLQAAEALERFGENFLTTDFSLTTPPSDLSPQRRYWLHNLTTRYGIDYDRYKFEVPGSSERLDILPSDTFYGDDWDKSFSELKNPAFRDRYMPYPQREGGDGYLYDLTGFFGQSRNPYSWPDLNNRTNGSGGVEQEDWLSQSSRLGLIEYVKVTNLTHDFPISVDANDGGYWFTDKDVPLVNSMHVGPPEAESTWLRSSNKVPAYQDTNKIRTVGDLSRGSTDIADNTYSYYYENNLTNQSIWYGYRLEQETGYFTANKTYYVHDYEMGHVIPIRINANTELARFENRIPAGYVNITGILWQYSLGKPGMEWEREAYMMQVWPRFLSDISPADLNEVDRGGVEKEPEVQDRGSNQEEPTLLKDRVIDIGDAIPLTAINILNCEYLNRYFESNNSAIRAFGGTSRLDGCDALESNQSIYYIVSGTNWYTLTRIFKFTKDSNGNCTCEGPLPSATVTNP